MSFFNWSKKNNSTIIPLEEFDVIDEAERASIKKLEAHPKSQSDYKKAKEIALKWKKIGIRSKLSYKAWKDIIYELPNDKNSDVTRDDIAVSIIKIKSEIDNDVDDNFNLMTK